jgi:hypothetical protein
MVLKKPGFYQPGEYRFLQVPRNSWRFYKERLDFSPRQENWKAMQGGILSNTLQFRIFCELMSPTDYAVLFEVER